VGRFLVEIARGNIDGDNAV